MSYFSDSRYCSRCHGEMTRDDYCHDHGWCKHCQDTVPVTQCKVPYWVVAATIGLLWMVQLGL